MPNYTDRAMDRLAQSAPATRRQRAKMVNGRLVRYMPSAHLLPVGRRMALMMRVYRLLG